MTPDEIEATFICPWDAVAEMMQTTDMPADAMAGMVALLVGGMRRYLDERRATVSQPG